MAAAIEILYEVWFQIYNVGLSSMLLLSFPIKVVTKLSHAQYKIYTDETYSSHVRYPDPLDLV